MTDIDNALLFASMLWGTVGSGYLIYGRKQQSPAAMVAGAVLIASSYFIESWLWMSLLCAGALAFKHYRD